MSNKNTAYTTGLQNPTNPSYQLSSVSVFRLDQSVFSSQKSCLSCGLSSSRSKTRHMCVNPKQSLKISSSFYVSMLTYQNCLYKRHYQNSKVTLLCRTKKREFFIYSDHRLVTTRTSKIMQINCILWCISCNICFITISCYYALLLLL